MGQQQDAIAEQRAANRPPGAPTGPRWDILPGSQRRQDWGDPSAPGQIAQEPRRPLWDTGGRTGSIRNGWDTPFYQTFFKQQEEAVEKGTLGQLYQRKDFTGVVTYDGAKDAQGRTAKFGDMYDGGKLIGNVRELYSRPEADEILATLTLDPRHRREVYRDMSRGDTDAVSRAVDEAAREETARQAKFLTQQDYNKRVETKTADFEGRGLTDELLTAAAGFAGGVATTWWAGPWSVVGGAVGATAAVLNQDEILDQAARARVQQEMAHEQFGSLGGAATGLLGWSALAGKFLQPVTNVLHGAYDGLSSGDIGDNRSQWYATDEKGESVRPALLTGLGVVAGFGDAALQFGSGVGRAAYSAQMGGTILGKVSQMATQGGQTFSDTRGAFDNVFTDDEGNFDPVSAAAGIGSVAIDAVQLGAAQGISRMFQRNETALRLGLGGQTVSVGGRSVKLDATGTAQWARGNNKRTSMNLSMLAPSEQLTAISTRVQAARLARIAKRDVITADDYYRAATRISEGNGKWVNALVTGVGEGYEEAIQGMLDPLSHHDEIDWRQVGEAALAGFAMGTGMQVGAGLARVDGRRQSSADEKAYQRAVLSMRPWATEPEADPEQVLPRAVWNAMTPAQKQAASKLSTTEAGLYKDSLARLQDSQRAGFVAGRPEAEKLTDAVRAQADQESARAGVRTDGSFVITQTEAADIRADAVVTSFDQTLRLLQAHKKGMQEQVTYLTQKGQATDAVTQVIAQTDVMLEALRDWQGQARQHRKDNTPQSRREFRRVVRDANRALEMMYDQGVTQNDKDPALVDARRRAVSLVFVRNPQDQTGSYQMFVPQISSDLTWTGSDAVVQLSHAVLQAFGGDFDGDKVVQQAKLILDDAAFANLRTGRNLVGALKSERVDPNGTLVKRDGTIVDPDVPAVNIGTRDYEKHEVNILAGALASPDTEAAAITAGQVVDNLVDAIESRYMGKIDGLVLFPILERLRENLRLGNVNARAQLLSDMVDLGGDQFWQVSLSGASNELLWLDNTYHRALQGFQSWNARNLPVSNEMVNTDLVRVIPKTSETWAVMQQAAATEGQTLAQKAEGWTLFRMFQKLHYSAYMANVVGAGDTAMSDALRDLQQAYEALSQGVTQSELEATGARDLISQKVIHRLQRMVGEKDAPSRSIAAIANMAVADITVVDGRAKVGDKPITMLQLLLRQAVNEDRHDNAEVVTPELEAKWARLDQLTQPGSSGEAFVSMMGPLTLWELLGTAASALGPQLTVEQFVRLYNSRGPEARRITSQRLRRDPSYGEREGKHDLPYEWSDVANNQVTSFRSVVEAMVEAGNGRVFLREKNIEPDRAKGGRKRLAGTAGGWIGERSDMYQDSLEDSFTLIHQAFTDMGWEPSSAQAVRAIFDRHPDFARGVLDLVPNADANAIFEVVDGELRMSNWVFEMLAMPPKQAAMHYWRNLVIAQWTAKGARHGEEETDKVREFHKLDNRMHQLMFQLQYSGDGGVALADFIHKMEAATDLDAFMAYVNTRVRPSSVPPYAAWVQEVDEFAPDKAGGGWSSGGSGTQQREAILVLRQRAENLVREIAEEKMAAAADDMLMSALYTAQYHPRSSNNADKELLLKLQEALEFSQEMLTAEGPNAMREQMLGTLRSFYPQAHTKGISPDAYLAAGAFQALADVAGYSTAYERIRDTLISVDEADIQANPHELSREDVDSMAADGAAIHWQALTVPRLLELWKRTDVDAKPLIRAMLFPSVYEKNAAGRLTQQFLTGKSITSLLERDTYRSFYEDSAQSKMTYLSMLESLGKKHGALFSVQRPMNDILLAHTTSAGHTLSTRDHERAIDQTMLDMADIARLVGDVYSNLGETFLTEIKESLREQLENRRGSEILNFRTADREYLKNIFEYEASERAAELATQAKEALDAGDPEKSERLLRYAASLKTRVEETLSSEPFQRFRDSLRIDWEGDPALVEQKKMELRDQILRFATKYTQQAPWATTAIYHLQNPVRTVNGVPVLSMDPRTDQDLWEKLLNAATASYMVDATSVQAQGLAVPELEWGKKQVRRYWDPTYSYLLDFLDPKGAFAKSALELHERTFGKSVKNHDAEELKRKIEGTILAPERLGPWSADIVTVSREANQRLDASSAGDAIAMAGIAPRQQFTISVATERTSRTDALAATTSKGRISLEALASNTGYFNTDLALAQFAGDQVTGSVVTPGVQSPIWLLNGRFAKGAKLLVDGVEVADLWTRRQPPLGRTNFDRPEVVNSGYRAITVRQLRKSVEAALPKNVDLSKVTIELDYVHPDSQPAKAGYYNSIFYDGVSFEATDQMRSLNATLWFGAGSISPDSQAEALGANKKGKLAYRLGKTFRSETRKNIERGFTTDFSRMITEKALALVRQDLGNGTLDPTFFNAVMKDVKLRHFVRGTVNDKPVLWTAEQVIAWQRANPGKDLSEVIQNPELWKPTARVLRTMFGETGDRGVRGALQLEMDLDESAISRYQGITPEMLARVPGWAGTTDLMTTPAAAHAFQGRFTMRPVATEDVLRKYDQAVQYRNGLRLQIHEARQDKWGEGQASSMVDRAVAHAMEALKSETPGLDFAGMGFPFIASMSALKTEISDMVLRTYKTALTLTGMEAGWIYREYYGDKTASLRSGEITQTSLDPDNAGYSAPKLHNQIAPGDLVSVDVSSFAGGNADLTAQLKLGEKRLGMLAGYSPVIALTVQDGQRELRTALGRHLEKIGYEKVAGSGHVYRPRQRDSVFQTRQARTTTLLETHTESARNMITLFLAKPNTPLAITENAAVFVSRNMQRSVALPVDLVPVNAYGGFGLPQGPAMIADVRNALTSMLNDPAKFQHLLRISDIEKADSPAAKDLRKALQAYLDTAGSDGLPKQGTIFGLGSILPLVDRDGRILLYRHGMKPPKEIDSQLREQLVPDDGPFNVAIYRNEPHALATSHTGFVVNFEKNSKYGLTVNMRIPLQNLGNKIQLEANGMKYVLTSRGKKRYLPDHDLFQNGVGIDLIADLDSALSKESTGGLVTNFRNGFAYFGIDFVPELLSFFTGQDYYSLSQQDQQNAYGLVQEILSGIHKKAGTLPTRAVQEMMQAPYLDRQVADILRSIDLSQVARDWQSDIVDVKDSNSVEQQIARAAVLYMLLPSAEPRHILRAGGMNSSEQVRVDGSQTVFMPRIFTEVFDNADPNGELYDHLFRKMNSTISNPKPQKGKPSQWYQLRKDWTFSMLNADGEQVDGVLQFADAVASGDNPITNDQAFARSTRQNWSRHSLDMAYQAIGGVTAAEKGLEKTKRFAGLRSEVARGSLWGILTDTTPPGGVPMFLMERPGELARRHLAYEAVGATRQELEKDQWEPGQEEQYVVRRTEVGSKMGLTPQQSVTIDFWVRQMLGMPLGEGDQGRIGFDWAMETLNEIEWNASEHLLPTAGAEIPQIHVYDLAMLFEANDGDRPQWWLNEGPGLPRVSHDWDTWTKIALGTGQVEHQLFDPLYLLVTDGLMHTFQDATETLVGLPVSRDVLVATKLMDASTDRLIQSIDPNTDVLGRDPILLETDLTTFADLMGAERIGGTFQGRQAPNSVLAKRRAQRLRWRKENGVPMPMDTTMANFRERGTSFVDDSTNSHAIFRILSNLRAGNALLNPLLWVAAGPEMWHRSLLDDATTLLMGTGTGVAGRAATSAKLATRYTPEQITQLQGLYRELGSRSAFRGMVYSAMMFQQPRLKNAGRIERWTHNYAAFASGMQDPTYGLRATSLARRYVDKVLEELAVSGAVISTEQVIAKLHTDPEWVQKHLPEIHQSAVNSLSQLRSLRATPLSLAFKGIYEPMSQSSHGPVNMAGHLVRIPLMFTGYMFNVMTTVTGMQGFSNIAAMFMEGRDKGFIGRIQAAMKGETFNPEDNRVDMKEALDGISLAKMFVQGGITHTGLFALGLAAGGLGLTGEDEEERRRRRAAQTTGGDYLYDPRRIENDWRNADAIFLDWMPPAFSSWFKVTGGDENGEEARSMARLPWIMKQFISPIIGMERFFDTGDPQQIIWGFADALGGLPLFNASMWDSATATFTELMANADDAAKLGTPRDLQKSYGFMVAALGTMERMLFENSFINMIYIGTDRYDRDQWKRPRTDSDGDIQYDLVGNPRETNAMSNYVDPETGEIRSGYVNRDWMDATLHQLSENRLGLALLSSLFTGGPNSSFFRTNMVVKQRDIAKPELTQEEAEGLLLSVIDTETYGRSAEGAVDDEGVGTELLTESGARAVFRSLYDGIIGFDSPALEGLYIPLEMRQSIQEKWMAELTAEGLAAGLDREQAESRMWDVMLGQGTSPYGVGIMDIIWAKEPGTIPYAETVRYNQLNTLYAMGPNGRPYATGVTRDGLHNLFGLAPSRYYVKGDSNIGTDARLNAVDEVLNMNLGMRGLERVDDSWAVPTDAEIGERIEKSIEALGENIEKALNDAMGNGWVNYPRRSGWVNYGRSYGRGYSGGGGGYSSSPYVADYGGQAQRMNTPRRVRSAYSDDLYSINTSNPIIRRATIRRERFSSQRGRLNQWQ